MSPAGGASDRAPQPPSPSPVIPSEVTWALAALLFLLFFQIQRSYPFQGYLPFVDVDRGYGYTSLIIAFIFFAPAIWFLPRGMRDKVGGIWLTAAIALFVFKWGFIDSNEPDFMFGNDRSDVLAAGLRNVMNGIHPYDISTPTTSLTTTFLLAAPFHFAFGRCEWMTVPMLLLGFATLLWQRRMVGGIAPVPILAVLLFFNPLVMYELVWGSDLIWGSALLILASAMLQRGWPILATVVFTFAICTRIPFFMLIPLWLGFLWDWLDRPDRMRTFALASLLGIVIGCLLELPLVLWDPKIFFSWAPVGVSSVKLAEAFPEGNNLFSDLINWAIPSGPLRKAVPTFFFFLFSFLFGWRARTIGQLNMGFAGVLGCMLFWMGSEFLIDYLVWLVLPLLMVLASWTPEWHLAVDDPKSAP